MIDDKGISLRVFYRADATLAQLVEQQTENLRVWSSILRGGIFWY